MSDFTMLARIERVPTLNKVSAKGIGVWSLLHHALDRRGRIELAGVDYTTLLLRRLPIDPASRQWFHAGLRELEQAGAFVVEGDVFRLVGHAGADVPERPVREPGRRSKRAMASGATPELPPSSVEPPTDLPPTSDGPSEDLSATSEQPPTDLLSGSERNHSESDRQIRIDQRREEEKRGEDTERARGPNLGSMFGLCEAAREGYVRRFLADPELAGVPLPLQTRGPSPMHGVWLEIARSVTGAEQLERLLDGAFADGWVRRSGFKPGTIVSEAVRILRDGPTTASKPARRGLAPVVSHEAHRAAVEAIAGKGAGYADVEL